VSAASAFIASRVADSLRRSIASIMPTVAGGVRVRLEAVAEGGEAMSPRVSSE